MEALASWSTRILLIEGTIRFRFTCPQAFIDGDR